MRLGIITSHFAVLCAVTTFGLSPATTRAETISGFSGGLGWTGNTLFSSSLPSVSGGTLTLTNGGRQATSFFYNTRVDISQAFTVNFTYRYSNASIAPADGITFAIQNDARGLYAVGSTGGGLGYGNYDNNSSPITPSLAVELNVYSGNSVGAGVGTNGTTYAGSHYPGILPVNLLQDPVAVRFSYDGAGASTITYTDLNSNATVTQRWSGIISSTVGGNSAYIGFTGGTGLFYANQQISNFSFNNVSDVSAAPLPSSAGAGAILIAGLGLLKLGRRGATIG